MRKRKEKKEDARQVIGEVGEPLEGAGDVARIGLPLVLLACAVGFVVGLLVFGLLRLSSFLIGLLWVDLPQLMPVWWLPIVVCTLGGLVIGVWTKVFDNAPEPLEVVMSQVKHTGGYQVKGVATSAVSFLLPLAFGGSVGPEAGLTGLIAAGCTWIGNTLKHAGLKAKAVVDLTLSASLSAIFGTPLLGIVATAEDGDPDSTRAANVNEYTFRRSAKLVLYSAAAFGSFGAVKVLVDVFGSGAGLPYFESIQSGAIGFLWAVPLALLGWALALLFHVSEHVLSGLGRRLEKHVVLMPVIAGVVLGTVACALPNVLFSGEAQCHDIMGAWTQSTALVLLATGVVKLIVTPLCLNFGWRGGHFFPAIFAGVSFGYGCAVLTGLDPMLCVTVVTTALMAGIMRKPLVALVLLIMCFPVDGILYSGLAAVIGAALPMPKLEAEGEAKS